LCIGDLESMLWCWGCEWYTFEGWGYILINENELYNYLYTCKHASIVSRWWCL
jgi:hypothetical protein